VIAPNSWLAVSTLQICVENNERNMSCYVKITSGKHDVVSLRFKEVYSMNYFNLAFYAAFTSLVLPQLSCR
jgi:hypothetical protein